MKVEYQERYDNLAVNIQSQSTNTSTSYSDEIQDCVENPQLNTSLVVSQTEQQTITYENKSNENNFLINKRSFKEQRQFILRTLCLIQFHLLGPLLLCVFCMFKTFLVELLWDQDEEKFSYLFYFSLAMGIFILFSVTFSRNHARRIPYAQTAYVFFGIFLSLILAGLYSQSYYTHNDSVGFIILALINIFQGSNAGALLYFASLKKKKSILYSIPFICIFPLLLSLIYMFFMQDQVLKLTCWIIAFVSICLAILSVNALYKMIEGDFKLEKDQHCIATIFLYIKMIAFCKDF